MDVRALLRYLLVETNASKIVPHLLSLVVLTKRAFRVASVPDTSTERHRALPYIAPVNQLPVELLSQIFRLSLRRRVRPSAKRAPLVLTHVCRHWRAVAIRTPELWQCLFLEFPCRPSLGSDLVQAFLARAGSRSLYIVLKCSDASVFVPPNMLETVSHFFPKCQRLDITLGRQDLLRFNTLAGRFPRLAAVRIQCVYAKDDRQPEIPVSIFRSPHLRSMDISSVLLQYSPKIIDLLPSCLTGLNIDIHLFGVEWDDLIRVVTRCPRLLHLGVGGCPTPVGVIDARLLKSLFISGQHAVQALDGFSAPALERLDVLLFYDHFTPHFLSFVARSGISTTLHDLTLWTVETSHASLLDILPALPALLSFRLISDEAHSTDLVQRYAVLQNADILPLLRVLSLTERALLSPPTALFLAVVHMRPNLRVAELLVEGRSHGPEAHHMLSSVNAETQFKALTKRGVLIRVKSPNAAECWPEDADSDDDIDNGGGMTPRKIEAIGSGPPLIGEFASRSSGAAAVVLTPGRPPDEDEVELDSGSRWRTHPDATAWEQP
ncbi:hypothetical protein GGX14DRAFT_637722 [Mycena pura]|uniref:F-box domain-containing protein n=1 Tax=Mycena pura TaxID=153505 RepID=A0AAD6Y9A3_9AGAR|nr:hypothetical protein GGX14DRAFT_637722 [Mycena pura]